MPGKALSAFADFVMLTNQYNLEAATESGILAEVQNQTYLTGELAKGKPTSQIVKTGKKITAFSQFTAGTQSGFYQPGDTFTTTIEDYNTQLDFYYRFMHDSFAYTVQEVEFNMGGRDQTGITTQIEDILKSRRQAQKIGMYNAVDAAWWTTPSAATMETAATANRPYSIRAFITEDGLHPSGFTTLAGVASTQTRYRNQVANYTAGAIDTTLKPAFATIKRKLGFESPPSMEKYLTESKWSRFLIASDISGVTTYQRLTEESNDRLGGNGKDLGYAADTLTYAGIPVKYIKEIDNLAFSSTQPRFYWMNTQYLYPVWHSSAYFAEMEPMTSREQPHVYTVHSDLWYQLICTSRQRQGIVCPG